MSTVLSAPKASATLRTLEQITQLVRKTVPEASKASQDVLIADLFAQEGKTSDGESQSAGRVGLKNGVVSELTSIVELKPGGAEHLRALFAMVRGNFSGADRVGTLHDMRFVFLENDTKLMFATTYDGDWDSYIDDFATKIPDLMDLIFSSAVGWPGIASPTVKDFIVSKQITAAGWYVANPRQTVIDVRRNAKVVASLDTFLDNFNKIE
jgi:hypothetical protein